MAKTLSTLEVVDATDDKFLRDDGTWQEPSGGGSGDVVGPASSTDEAFARFDSTTGKLLMDGVVTSTDAGVVAGITQLNVDNVRVDGNTISTTDANGDLVVSPNGTGILRVRAAGYGLGQGGSSLIGRAGGENVWSATASVFSLSANHNLVGWGHRPLTQCRRGVASHQRFDRPRQYPHRPPRRSQHGGLGRPQRPRRQ